MSAREINDLLKYQKIIKMLKYNARNTVMRDGFLKICSLNFIGK